MSYGPATGPGAGTHSKEGGVRRGSSVSGELEEVTQHCVCECASGGMKRYPLDPVRLFSHFLCPSIRQR